MKFLTLLLALAIAVLPLQGCSAVMAVRQPSKKNLGVLQSGTPRDNVITHLGPPVTSDQKDGGRVEVYSFTQGYTGANKATRATCYVILDAMTIFLWELIGIPAELMNNGHRMTIKVTYDEKDRLKDFIYLAQAE